MNIIRFLEVLLWRAEITAYESDLEMAKTFRVRERAAKPFKFCQKKGRNTPVTNFPDIDIAINAADFEERIALVPESHRFLNWLEKVKHPQVLNA